MQKGSILKGTLLSIILSSTLYGKLYPLNEIEKMPKSIARDYYIWRLLNESRPSEDEALKALLISYLRKKTIGVKKVY